MLNEWSYKVKKIDDGISRPGIEVRPYKLLSTVCVSGGINCPICDNDEIRKILNLLKNDPTLRIRFISDVDEIPFAIEDFMVDCGIIFWLYLPIKSNFVNIRDKPYSQCRIIFQQLENFLNLIIITYWAVYTTRDAYCR